MSNLKIIVLVVCLVPFFLFSQGGSCVNMIQVCPDSGSNIILQGGSPAAAIVDPVNNYDCLTVTPSPTWFYFEVSQSGDINLTLSAPSDIDFIVYGPFTSVIDAQNSCGSFGYPRGTPIVDCSYSGLSL